jgi:hypothetical protein
MRDVPDTTPCTFIAPPTASSGSSEDVTHTTNDLENEDALLADGDNDMLLANVPGPAIGVPESVSLGLLSASRSGGALELWPWANTTPITIGPRLPLELAAQLFRRMGPRVILVEERGRLRGLLTMKDVLRFTERAGAHLGEDEHAGALGEALEEGWDWATDKWTQAVAWGRRRVRR